MSNSNSTYTLQRVIDYASTFPELQPVLTKGGYTDQPAIEIANDVMQYMLANFPYKWNEIILPVFYANSYQQDYATFGVNNLFWLQDGTVLQTNSTVIPKPRLLVEVDRDLPQMSANLSSNSFFSQPTFFVNWLPNDQLYYGVWGGSPASSGNDPVTGSVYTSPLGAATQPVNPITQIRDANGNLLLLTTYGTEGTTAPVAPSGSAPGTTCNGSGATTVWTVVDPKGQGFRIAPVPSQTGPVWQFNLRGQARPILFTSLQQTLAPIPDDYSNLFKQGFITYCYRHSPEASVRGKFETEFKLWEASLMDARMKSDRERDSSSFVPDGSIIADMGYGYVGPAWPFSYPVS